MGCAKNCIACELHQERTQVVMPDGPDGGLLAVGEAPGADEDAHGVGFIGSAGKTLEKEIATTLGLPRSSWARANIVRCRPPGNRRPKAAEIDTCMGCLDQTLDTKRPSVILAVGETAGRILAGGDIRSGAYLPQVETIVSRAMGATESMDRALPAYRSIPVVPMPHTSGLAWNRQFNGALGRRPIAALGRDAIRVAGFLNRAVAA
ncbi:uracil-DNA glycosylase [Thioalkalivibrio sp. ALE23]|uniref:uracil-DNA glycosylase n=1 Tax=Thioalkalivibrio sp. ALE23 TaxID=1265495 RepID=UPI00039DB307|nr:uracil-DNA glycosylase [Thioalkalivibrio sp. ALE23]